LNPPGTPGRSFNKAIPGRGVEHAEALEFRVGGKHPTGDVQKLQILGVSFAPEKLALKRFGPGNRLTQEKEPKEDWEKTKAR
jgi:hypothetical protein